MRSDYSYILIRFLICIWWIDEVVQRVVPGSLMRILQLCRYRRVDEYPGYPNVHDVLH